MLNSIKNLCFALIKDVSRFPIVDGIPIMLTRTGKNYEYQKEYFDREFKGYDKYELENWRRSYLKRIFNALNICNNSSDLYLDIGVGGSGYTVIEAARIGCRSVGLDISFEGLKKARHFASSELGMKNNLCNFVVGSAENLPFKDKAFSKISSIAVLEHVPNDKLAIAEIARVIKPFGEIFITVPNTYKQILPVFWLPYYFWDKRVGHLRHYKAKDLMTEFFCHGFLPREVAYSGHLIKVLQNLGAQIFPDFRKKNSRLWWKLEEMDLGSTSPRGLQLTLIMRKAK